MAAFAERAAKPVTPLPELPADTPSSVALRAVKASGDTGAGYKRHVGPQQRARWARQEATRQRNAARRTAAAGSAA